ncbi:MAG: hypothetical protein HC822_14240 [Oscillochloris sp.]|nr:hypothetical protein [Oscillochloris sp.]
MHCNTHPTTRAERRACREEARLRLGPIAMLKPRQPEPINHRQQRQITKRMLAAETRRAIA